MVVIIDLPAPEDGLRYSEPNTGAFYKDQNLGKGTLYIAESRVCWISNDGQGFSLQYPSINLHAVSKDSTSFPEHCLYLMISEKLDESEETDTAVPESINVDPPAHEGSGDDEDGEDEDEEEEVEDVIEDVENLVNEIRFVPDNKDVLDIMFKAMSDCQALHPDAQVEDEVVQSDGSGVDDDDDEGNYEDAEGDDAIYYVHGGEVHSQGGGGDTLASAANDSHDSDYFNGQIEAMEIGQFEDADQTDQ